MVKPSGDWNRMIASWDFNMLLLNGCEDWETPAFEGDHLVPANILLTIKKGTDRSSRDIAIETDDWSEGLFYYRDFTNDGIPFVRDGETYRGIFYFQKESDAKEFHKRYGGQYDG